MNRPQSRGPGKLQWQERMAGEHPGIFRHGPRVQTSPAALGRSALPQRDEQGPPGLFCTSSGYEKAKVLPVAFQAPRPSKHLPSSLMGCLSLHPLRSIHWPCCTWPVPHLLLLGNCHPSAWNVPTGGLGSPPHAIRAPCPPTPSTYYPRDLCPFSQSHL